MRLTGSKRTAGSVRRKKQEEDEKRKKREVLPTFQEASLISFFPQTNLPVSSTQMTSHPVSSSVPLAAQEGEGETLHGKTSLVTPTTQQVLLQEEACTVITLTTQEETVAVPLPSQEDFPLFQNLEKNNVSPDYLIEHMVCTDDDEKKLVCIM